MSRGGRRHIAGTLRRVLSSSQWLLMVCYHYSVTDPNLKPIFCVHSSIEPVNVISNAFINENQLFETVELS